MEDLRDLFKILGLYGDDSWFSLGFIRVKPRALEEFVDFFNT